MIDDQLPTPSGIDAESEPGDDDPSDEDPNERGSSGRESSARLPDAKRPARGSEASPDRATDPPPDSGEGERRAVDDPGPDPAGDDDTDESKPLEYRLERLRLWRAVVTLAVVVGRLIRSL